MDDVEAKIRKSIEHDAKIERNRELAAQAITKAELAAQEIKAEAERIRKDTDAKLERIAHSIVTQISERRAVDNEALEIRLKASINDSISDALERLLPGHVQSDLSRREQERQQADAQRKEARAAQVHRFYKAVTFITGLVVLATAIIGLIYAVGGQQEPGTVRGLARAADAVSDLGQ